MSHANTDNQVSLAPETRRERKRAELTERIMEVAREMFVRDGYEAVTLRKIALAIEYSPGAIYQYFKDKQALVKAIIQRDFEEIQKQILKCMKLEDPRERLIEMARRYAFWGITHPNHYRLLLVPPSSWLEQEVELRHDLPLPLEQEAIKLLHDSVIYAMEHGIVKDKYQDPALIAATLWAAIHGVILLEITMTDYDRKLIGDENISFEGRLETLRDVFLDGFLK